MDALDPCMIELCVADISTVLEPSTATSTTAEQTRCLYNAALVAPITAAAGANHSQTCRRG